MKSELPHDMKLEEFKQLAAREPNLDGQWIYRLCQMTMDSDVTEPYPRFDLSRNRDEYFLSYYEAAVKIKKLAEADLNDTYCFKIEQIPLGEPEECGACWLFDHQGKLIDYSITTWTGDAFSTAFFGRPESRNRFNKGDIVEVIRYEEIRLAIVLNNPPSPKWCHDLYKRTMSEKKPYYGLDSSDDCCIIIDGPGYGYHSHVSPLALMKPRFPIPADLEAEIKSWLAIAEAPPKEDEPFRCKYHHAKGEYIDDFYNLKITIHFGEDAPVPHIHIYDLFGLDLKLRIDRPEYFEEGDNDNQRLTDNQKEALMDYLEEADCCRNNWWYMLRKYNDFTDEPQYRIPLSTPLPNYRLL